MSNTQETIDRLLDFTHPIDTALLDSVVTAFFTGVPSQRDEAQKVLTAFQANPESWSRVDSILEYSQNPNTKYLALQILESVIKYRWKALPREQCEGIKTYIVSVIIKLSSDAATLAEQKLYIGKLNVTLVRIIAQEWPAKWENFIPEIVGASKTNESLCENNMQILQLLSEEVFDFSSGNMTAARASQLKASFNREFSLIFELCQLILDRSLRPSLLSVTLGTLHKVCFVFVLSPPSPPPNLSRPSSQFMSWIPVGYVFQTNIIEVLVNKFFPEPLFRTITLECLTEVAGITTPEYDAVFLRMYLAVITRLRGILPVNADLTRLYAQAEFQREQEFILHLSNFLTTFFRHHRAAVEVAEATAENIEGHEYLAKISTVDDDEVFKICLEYWNLLAADLYHEAPHLSSAAAPKAMSAPLMLGDTAAAALAAMATTPRRTYYAAVLSKARHVIISRFAKPEEVLITEDENGEVVREYVKDTEATALYKLMREALVYLTHLDATDTQDIMLSKLRSQVDGTGWSRAALNSLSWAVGSISGAMHEDAEKRFVVTVIRDLLGLVEQKRGKDNKAAIAGNIMYVVGQYPRFLRAHWKFLKTVVNKLFEFMHEQHPGVQDMAVDTFLKIAVKTKRKFVVLNAGESRPFVDEILDSLTNVICDLEAQQQCTFYQAMGHVIGAAQGEAPAGAGAGSGAGASQRDALIVRLMALPNQAWQSVMRDAAANIGVLRDPEVMKRLANILRINVAAASTIGTAFSAQLGLIYLDMLNVYRVYSEAISAEVSTGNPHATKTLQVKLMRSVKQEVLRLVETYVEHSQQQDSRAIAGNFIPPLLATILPDYAQSAPDARDAQVLSVLAAVISRLMWVMTPEVPRIFAHVFSSTLDMITHNFTDYPDHRIQFFELIRSVNASCFDAFFQLTQPQFKLVMDSIVWAFKHTERTVASTGLTILQDMLTNIASHPDISDAFYLSYYRSILSDLFYVLTDTFHKAEFKQHAGLLKHLFTIVETGQVKVPLWDQQPAAGATATAAAAAAAAAPTPQTNQQWLRTFVIGSLSTAFPNVPPQHVQAYVLALLDVGKDVASFKAHLRDFLVSIKEFSTGDNTELFLEETEAAEAKASAEDRQRRAAIPGMLKPSELAEDMTEGDM